MKDGQNQFVGLAGEYYVAYRLATLGLHAALTRGNAPNVDVLVASAKGDRHLSLQVKTTPWARRANRYGEEALEWHVGWGAMERNAETVWYALVDLQQPKGGVPNPAVYLVPSRWVKEHIKPFFTRPMYWMNVGYEGLCKEQWPRITSYLEGQADATKWATSLPADFPEYKKILAVRKRRISVQPS